MLAGHMLSRLCATRLSRFTSSLFRPPLSPFEFDGWGDLGNHFLTFSIFSLSLLFRSRGLIKSAIMDNDFMKNLVSFLISANVPERLTMLHHDCEI